MDLRKDKPPKGPKTKWRWTRMRLVGLAAIMAAAACVLVPVFFSIRMNLSPLLCGIVALVAFLFIASRQRGGGSGDA